MASRANRRSRQPAPKRKGSLATVLALVAVVLAGAALAVALNKGDAGGTPPFAQFPSKTPSAQRRAEFSGHFLIKPGGRSRRPGGGVNGVQGLVLFLALRREPHGTLDLPSG